MKDLYPVFLNLHDKKCLVVGGGQVAARKVRALLAVRADITLVSPQVIEEIQKLDDYGLVTIVPEKYGGEKHLQEAFLVISAVNDPQVNEQVYLDCLSRNILVNIVDDPGKCTFFVPSVVSRGALSIAISTEGKSPALARRLREELEAQFGPEYEDFAEILGELRKQVKTQVHDPNKRRKIFSELASDKFFQYYLELTAKEFGEKVQTLIKRHCM